MVGGVIAEIPTEIGSFNSISWERAEKEGKHQSLAH